MVFFKLALFILDILSSFGGVCSVSWLKKRDLNREAMVVSGGEI